MHRAQPTMKSDDNLYYDETFPSATALFHPEISYTADSHHNIPQQRQSVPMDAQLKTYFSRPSSLSPSSQTIFPQHHSPSSASPGSNFSISATDDFLLANSFSTNELDMFLFQSGDNFAPRQGSLYLPQNRSVSDTYYPPSSAGAQTLGDETYDMLSHISSPMDQHQRKFPIASEGPYPIYSNTANLASVQPPVFQQTSQLHWNQQPIQHVWPSADPTPQGWSMENKVVSQSNPTIYPQNSASSIHISLMTRYSSSTLRP